jgi:hypothetical protein
MSRPRVIGSRLLLTRLGTDSGLTLERGTIFHHLILYPYHIILTHFFHSASAPTFAAIISLLNNARLSVGQPPLGFLNPWLYATGKDAWTDIVDGGSTGCTGRDMYTGLPTPFVPFASWNATVGWDPVSGLGTPKFEELLAMTTPNHNLSQIVWNPSA